MQHYENNITQLILHAQTFSDSFRTQSVGIINSFAAFILIMMKVSYEYNFDTCYPDSDRIAVLNLSVDHHPNELIVLPRPFVEGVIEETPAIECGAFFDCSPNYAELISTDAKQPQYIYEPVTVVSPDLPEHSAWHS